MKVKIFIETEVEADIPEKFSPIADTEWWREGSEEINELAEEMWTLANTYGKVIRIENEYGETILEA